MTSRLRIIVAGAAVASSLLVWSPAARLLRPAVLRFLHRLGAARGRRTGGSWSAGRPGRIHPFQVSIGFAFNTTESQGAKIPDGSVKDLQVEPTGLVGDADAVPQCPQETFEQSFLFTQDCPADTQIGILTLDTTLAEITVPLFNLTPPPGVPARFGVFALITPVIMDASVGAGGDYGLTVNLHNLSQLLPVLGGTAVLWGVPADKRHDALRGSCLESGGGSSGECPSNSPAKPS